MVREVIVELPDILERDRVPQAAPPSRVKELAPQDIADRTVGHRVVHFGQPLCTDRPDHPAAGTRGAHACRDARIRARVDEDTSVNEDPVGLLEGIDHALVRNSSERPREDHHVERRVRQSK